jgi:large subunit ribosomal protein L24
MRINKGDLVKVISGDKRWKGQTGRVLEVFTKTKRLRIEGVRPIKRHLKPQKNPRHPEGGIIEDTGTIHASNVMLMSEVHDRPVRTGSVFTESGNKNRVARGRGLKPDPV